MTRLPNFLYLGPDKAGSTWLHEVLIQHPEVWLTPAKDLYFFDRYYDRGTDWYERQFEGAGTQPIVGEICQDYLVDEHCPQRIRETLGRPTLMVTLRDPVPRAFSSYLYMRKHGEGPDSFAQALENKPALTDHARYGSQLQRYLDVFGEESLHVALFDDLEQDPQAFLDDLLARLGVEPMALAEADRATRLPASRARFLLLAWAVRQGANVVRRFDGASLVGKVKRSALVHRVLYVPLVARPEPDPAAVQLIKDRLCDEVALAEKLSGLPLRDRWGW